MNQTTEKYDEIADGPFAQLYPFYAKLVTERTHITTGNLLDIGSNKGDFGFAVLDRGNFDSATFLDIRSEPLEKVHAYAKAHNYAEICHTLCGNADEGIDLPNDFIDLAISRGSLPFWENQEQAIREIFRVLAPEGVAYIDGGLGTREMKKRIVGDVSKIQGKPFKPEKIGKDNTLRLSERDYVELFEDMGCSYAIINAIDEGHWLIFAKKPAWHGCGK